MTYNLSLLSLSLALSHITPPEEEEEEEEGWWCLQREARCAAEVTGLFHEWGFCYGRQRGIFHQARVEEVLLQALPKYGHVKMNIGILT